MSKKNQNNCRYLGFIKAWRTFLERWLYITVVVFISTQIAILAAQPALALQNDLEQFTELTVAQTPDSEDTSREQDRPQASTPNSGDTSAGQDTPQARPLPVPKELTTSDQPLNLYIKYLRTKLYNPSTQKNDDVILRGYTDTDNSQSNIPYVAPTIKVDPGDTLRINLQNNLPKKDSSCTTHKPEDVNDPHCFNRTNLHTHGLWISPAGNSDNVALSINPGESFEYEYNIPQDHPAGTFWYHPHLHGSTAIQVANGMVGALIVNGNRKPNVGQSKFNDGFIHGDIDTLLAGLDNMQERVLVLQQIPYACGKNDDHSINWNCKNDKIGKVDSYDLFGFGSWEESERYTSINGEVLPEITSTQGTIEQWRMIHGGVRETINLEFYKKKDNSPVDMSKSDWIKDNCKGAPIDYYIISEDGLTRSRARKTKLATLQPGYRIDALVVFPQDGEYCVIDESAPAGESPGQNSESRQLLAVVKVAADVKVDSIKDQLIAAAKKEFGENTDLGKKVVEDLNKGLKLTLFEPHPKITDKEVAHTHRQEMAFFIDTSTTPSKYQVSNGIGSAFNPKSYDPKRIDRKLKVGDAEEWVLTSYFGGHPFHIHVNPFQIVKILDPNGKDVSAPGKKDCYPNENPDGNCPNNSESDPEYPGLKGVWKDSVFVKQDYTVVVRTRYERYIGDFVQHCHILDHEDEGMMENISIVPASEFSH